MTTRRVKAVWDSEAKVYFAESDIPGLHVEAETFDELVAIVRDVLADLDPSITTVDIEAQRIAPVASN